MIRGSQRHDPHLRALRIRRFRAGCRQQRLLRRDTGEAIPLTAKVFDTLLYLVEHAGETLDRDVLLRSIWPGVIVEENSLTPERLDSAPGAG